MTAPLVGDRVRMTPQTFGAGTDRPGETAKKHIDWIQREPVPPLPGTVTYVHPSGRWYQVTFDVGIKECFFVDPDPTPILRDGNHHRA